MRTDFDRELEERLVRYTAIDSQSDETSGTAPSTAIQFEMLHLLRAELEEMGAEDVALTDYGAVLATVPATTVDAPSVGFLAHVDTAPAYQATGVRPRVHRNWDGSDITYPEAPDLTLSPARSAYLATKVGHDIVTASGGTLLGADDKAGVAIAMTAVRHLLAHPEIPHGRIRVAFTPDEEIGRGVDPRLPADLGVDFAYTLDAAEVGEVEFESFSADAAVVRVTGVSAHPGWAKGVLVNALHLAARIVQTLPQATLTPETTEGREGFVHLYQMGGTAAEAELKFILRDFEREGLAAKGALLQQVCAAVAATEPRANHLRDPGPVPQHALLARDRHAARGACPRRLRGRGDRGDLEAHPGRHRRVAADRDGRAHAQHLHRHAGDPRPPRMGQRAGHGGGHEGGDPAGGDRGRRLGESGREDRHCSASLKRAVDGTSLEDT
jgi:tripeptide aminopeptidase